MAFWKNLRNLLEAIERELAIWWLVESGLPATTIELALAEAQRTAQEKLGEELVRGSDAAAAVFDWGPWTDRRDAFWTHAADRVESLTWSEVQRICGPRVNALARVVSGSARSLLERKTPDRVVLRSFRVVGVRGERAFLGGYSRTDTVEVPAGMLPVLNQFAEGNHVLDGAMPALSRLEREVADALLDHQIIVAAETHPTVPFEGPFGNDTEGRQ